MKKDYIDILDCSIIENDIPGNVEMVVRDGFNVNIHHSVYFRYSCKYLRIKTFYILLATNPDISPFQFEAIIYLLAHYKKTPNNTIYKMIIELLIRTCNYIELPLYVLKERDGKILKMLLHEI